MSVLSALSVIAATTGSGIYTEAGYDVLLSDRVSLVARGQRIIGEVGYFHGDFIGSYGLGPYSRYGLGMSWEPLHLAELRVVADETVEQELTIQFFYPHLVFTRGIDLFRVGVWGKLRLGPVWSVVEQNDFYNPDTVWGGQLTSEVAFSYNVGSVLKIAPRLGVGILIDEVRTSYQVSFGLGIHLQAAFRSVDSGPPADYWEKDY